MSTQTLENAVEDSSSRAIISNEDARRLRVEVLEMRRLALKFAQRAHEISKILDLITELDEPQN
jgi:hypothetical protein